NDPQAKSTLYNIGFAIGITTFFYFPSLAFALLIIFALVITRPPRLAEWIIAVLGIATPWYLLFAWLFLTNRLYSFHVPGIQVVYPLLVYDLVRYIGIFIILITA